MGESECSSLLPGTAAPLDLNLNLMPPEKSAEHVPAGVGGPL